MFVLLGFKNWQGDAVRCFTIWDIDEEQAGLSMVVDKENAIPIVHVDCYHKLVYFSGYVIFIFVFFFNTSDLN